MIAGQAIDDPALASLVVNAAGTIGMAFVEMHLLTAKKMSEQCDPLNARPRYARRPSHILLTQAVRQPFAGASPEGRVYGQRELVIRDCNGLILAFGEETSQRAI